MCILQLTWKQHQVFHCEWQEIKQTTSFGLRIVLGGLTHLYEFHTKHYDYELGRYILIDSLGLLIWHVHFNLALFKGMDWHIISMAPIQKIKAKRPVTLNDEDISIYILTKPCSWQTYLYDPLTKDYGRKTSYLECWIYNIYILT